MRRRSAPRICSSCPYSDAESDGRTRRVSTAIPGVAIARRASRFCASGGSTIGALLEDESLWRTYRCVDDRAGQNLARCPNMKPAATVQPKSVTESGERPRDISSVFDEHIDVHPARPGESLTGGCIENSRRSRREQFSSGPETTRLEAGQRRLRPRSDPQPPAACPCALVIHVEKHEGRRARQEFEEIA